MSIFLIIFMIFMMLILMLMLVVTLRLMFMFLSGGVLIFVISFPNPMVLFFLVLVIIFIFMYFQIILGSGGMGFWALTFLFDFHVRGALLEVKFWFADRFFIGLWLLFYYLSWNKFFFRISLLEKLLFLITFLIPFYFCLMLHKNITTLIRQKLT